MLIWSRNTAGSSDHGAKWFTRRQLPDRIVAFANLNIQKPNTNTIHYAYRYTIVATIHNGDSACPPYNAAVTVHLSFSTGASSHPEVASLDCLQKVGLGIFFWFSFVRCSSLRKFIRKLPNLHSAGRHGHSSSPPTRHRDPAPRERA